MRSLFVIFLLYITIVTFSQETKYTFSWDCTGKIPCYSLHAYSFVRNDGAALEKLKYNLDILSSKLGALKYSQEEYILYANAYVTWKGYCFKNDISYNLNKFIDETGGSHNVKLVYKEFCDCTYDDINKKLVKGAILVDKYKWMKKELFCAWSRDMANLYKIDVGIIKEVGDQLEDLSIKTCDQLREDKITLYDAHFRFHQELSYINKKLDKSFWDYLFESLMEIDPSDVIKLIKSPK